MAKKELSSALDVEDGGGVVPAQGGGFVEQALEVVADEVPKQFSIGDFLKTAQTAIMASLLKAGRYKSTLTDYSFKGEENGSGLFYAVLYFTIATGVDDETIITMPIAVDCIPLYKLDNGYPNMEALKDAGIAGQLTKGLKAVEKIALLGDAGSVIRAANDVEDLLSAIVGAEVEIVVSRKTGQEGLPENGVKSIASRWCT